jgi:hypothetical protein
MIVTMGYEINLIKKELLIKKEVWNMRIIMLALAFLAVATTTYAQTQKGIRTLGGSFNVYYSAYCRNESLGSEYLSSSETFAAYPKIGFFVTNNLSIGVGLSGSLTKYDSKRHYEYGDTSYYSTETKTVTVSPFVRSYHMLTEKSAFFTQLSGGFGYGRDRQENPNVTVGDVYQISADGCLGLVYFISQRWGFETSFGSLNYLYNVTDYGKDINGNKINTTASTFRLNVSLSSLYIGMQYHF